MQNQKEENNENKYAISNRKTCKLTFAYVTYGHQQALTTKRQNSPFVYFPFFTPKNNRIDTGVKPLPNDPNISTQHIPTLSGTTYNMLRAFGHPVARCCDNGVLLARI